MSENTPETVINEHVQSSNVEGKINSISSII